MNKEVIYVYPNRNIPLEKRKKKKFVSDPKKMNIIQIQRKLNSERINNDQRFKHNKMLYRLAEVQENIDNYLKEKKLNETFEIENNGYPVFVNKKSEQILKKKREKNHLERTGKWIEKKEEKLMEKKKEINEEKMAQEILDNKKYHNPKNKRDSKVLKFIHKNFKTPYEK